MLRHFAIVAVLFFITVSAPALSQAQRPQDASEASGVLALIPADSKTQHILSTPSGDLGYEATAGTFDLFGQDGALSAKVFYTAYVAEGQSSDRPITFVFNGGPGAASAYLHIGLVGPRILEFDRSARNGTTPSLSDNPDSWLPFTDLVLIDPVGTGWSRASGGDAADRFYGVRQDADSLAKVIALYVQENGRLESPKYLLGESYGGFRAAKVAKVLKDRQGMLVSGVVMVSPMIEGRFLTSTEEDPLAAALLLPSIVAARLERDDQFTPEKQVDVERFAMNDYLVSLAGPPPTGDEATEFYRRVSDMTGIPLQEVEAGRGFVGGFLAKSMAGSDEIVSRYDSALAAPDAYPERGYVRNDDPVLDGYTRAYGSALATYASQELGYECRLTYVLLNNEINRRWDWRGSRSTASASDDIRDLLSVIPSFRLMIVHGYTDTLTPYGVSRFVLDHLPSALAAGRAELRVYRGGHMFYAEPASRRALTNDLRVFYEDRGS